MSGVTNGWVDFRGNTHSSAPSSPRWGGHINATKCEKCKKSVYVKEEIKMEGFSFHKNCLRCNKCNCLLNPQNIGGFVGGDNIPFCDAHFEGNEKTNSKDTTEPRVTITVKSKKKCALEDCRQDVYQGDFCIDHMISGPKTLLEKKKQEDGDDKISPYSRESLRKTLS